MAVLPWSNDEAFSDDLLVIERVKHLASYMLPQVYSVEVTRKTDRINFSPIVRQQLKL